MKTALESAAVLLFKPPRHFEEACITFLTFTLANARQPGDSALGAVYDRAFYRLGHEACSNKTFFIQQEQIAKREPPGR